MKAVSTRSPRIPKAIGLNGNVLVRYTTTRFSVKRQHDAGTESLHSTFGAGRNLSAAVRILDTKGNVLGKLLSAYGTTLLKIKKLGLSLPDRQGVLIRISDLEEAQTVFEESDSRVVELKGELANEYDALVQASKDALQRASDSVDYPPARVVLDSFTHHLGVFAPPGKLPLLGGVTKEVAAKARAASAESQRRMFRDAFGGLIRSLIQNLIGTDKDKGLIEHVANAKRLREERLVNLREDLQHARHVQASIGIDIPELDAVVRALEPFAELSRETLTENKTMRTETANQMRTVASQSLEVLKRMGAA